MAHTGGGLGRGLRRGPVGPVGRTTAPYYGSALLLVSERLARSRVATGNWQVASYHKQRMPGGNMSTNQDSTSTLASLPPLGVVQALIRGGRGFVWFISTQLVEHPTLAPVHRRPFGHALNPSNRFGSQLTFSFYPNCNCYRPVDTAGSPCLVK